MKTQNNTNIHKRIEGILKDIYSIIPIGNSINIFVNTNEPDKEPFVFEFKQIEVNDIDKIHVYMNKEYPSINKLPLENLNTFYVFLKELVDKVVDMSYTYTDNHYKYFEKAVGNSHCIFIYNDYYWATPKIIKTKNELSFNLVYYKNGSCVEWNSFQEIPIDIRVKITDDILAKIPHGVIPCDITSFDKMIWN